MDGVGTNKTVPVETLTERQAIERLRETVTETVAVLRKMTDVLETLSDRITLLGGRMDATERRIKGL